MTVAALALALKEKVGTTMVTDESEGFRGLTSAGSCNGPVNRSLQLAHGAK